MWKKIENILATEEWFRFDTSLALCRVWYVGRDNNNDSIVVQATMEMYINAAGKVMRPTQQLVGSGEGAWEAYRAGEAYRVIRSIIQMPRSDELLELIGTNFRQERVYLNGVVLLGRLEQPTDDARIRLCATTRAGLHFTVGAATPQPKPASQKQEAALAAASCQPAHQL